MNKPTLEVSDFVKQVFLRSRGRGDVNDPYCKGIFVLPKDVIDYRDRPVPQYTLDRLWKRAVKEGYAFLETKHVYVKNGKNKCNTYKLDRERIVLEFGQSIFSAKSPTGFVDVESAIRESEIFKRPRNVGKVGLNQTPNCSLMDRQKDEERKKKVFSIKSVLDEIDPGGFYKVPVDLLDSINSKIKHPASKLDWSVNVKIKRNKPVVAGRMHSGNCCIKKNERALVCPHLFENGVVEYDVRSTVPAVVRLLGTGEWISSGQDLKDDVLKESGVELSKAQLKRILLPMLFNPTIKTAWRTYDYRTRNLESRRVSKEKFEKVWSAASKVIGQNVWGGTIFFFESMIELYAIKNIQERGTFVGSVYDCFWCKNLTVKEIEQCITDAALYCFQNVFDKAPKVVVSHGDATEL